MSTDKAESPIVFAEILSDQAPFAEAAGRLCAYEFVHGLDWGDTYRVFAATENDEVVGVVNTYTRPNHTSQISHVVVAPDRRGHGIGTLMLLKTLGLMKDAGILKADLFTPSETVAALYGRLGFAEDPVTLLMELDLTTWSPDDVAAATNDDGRGQ